jgi:hypothetical protein
MLLWRSHSDMCALLFVAIEFINHRGWAGAISASLLCAFETASQIAAVADAG